MELQRLTIGLNDSFRVYIDGEDRYTGGLLMGKSGTGKSTEFEQFWYQDSLYPVAKILIESSDHLAKKCYSISKGNANYCSLDHPLSLNPMQAPYNPNQISDIIAEALNQVIKMTTSNENLTVKMRGILDEAVKWCLQRNRKSLIHVRDCILNMKEDGVTREGILHRINFLINDERIQPIICGNNSIEWGKLIQKGESFILDGFGMSREKMIFVGNIISHGIKNYFMYDRPREYKPLAMYVDEAHNFVNFNFLSILKEGRKFKLSCLMATQDFATIDEKLARVMANVGTLLSFRVGYREAQLLAREMGFKTDELQNLEKYHLAYRTPKERGIAKAPRPPFYKQLDVKKVEPKSAPKSKWFVLEPIGSYLPAKDYEPQAGGLC
ncbi:MAG: hypothetical protein HZB31_15350 [Nitrospirae bacterium]|nr:hypothetical protein [Nitrospirota bacterium]